MPKKLTDIATGLKSHVKQLREKSFGVNLDLEQIYKDAAAMLNIEPTDLTEEQKKAAFLDATLAQVELAKQSK